jgi:2-keto-4-pentenoate hydratase/2-oxohepta-3-ene-1,7-dioic acid hydratase in catechol pathway
MKLASFLLNGRRRIGVIDSDASSVQPLDENLVDMNHLIEQYGEIQSHLPLDGPAIPLGTVTLLPPIIPRRNIFCVGKNYRAHAKEFAGSGIFQTTFHRYRTRGDG